MNHPELSIIVPCFNEAENIPELHAALSSAFPVDGEVAAEFIFVDDGSTDASDRVLTEIGAQDDRVHPLRLTTRGGQTNALWQGLQLSRADWVAHLDGDLQNDPQDLPGMLALAKQRDWDAVLGFRSRRDDDLGRRLASRFANSVRQLILGDNIRDVGCSTRVVRRTVLLQLPPIPNQHRYLPALIEKGNWRCTQVSTSHHGRRHGVSKYGNLNRGLEGLRDLPRMVSYARSHRAREKREGES